MQQQNEKNGGISKEERGKLGVACYSKIYQISLMYISYHLTLTLQMKRIVGGWM